MDVEARVAAIEQRLAGVENTRRDEGRAMQQLFELAQRIDGSMTILVARVTALETNFSLVNAALNTLVARIDALNTIVPRVDALECAVGSLAVKVGRID